jgi:hypothetical protein
VLELGIGVAGLILSAVTYYLGRRQGQASDKKLDALQREMSMMRSALEHSGVRLEEERDPQTGELRDVRIVRLEGTLPLSGELHTLRLPGEQSSPEPLQPSE